MARIIALKFKHQSKDEIPAQLQSLYVERDGAWVLDVEGAALHRPLKLARKSQGAVATKTLRCAWKLSMSPVLPPDE